MTSKNLETLLKKVRSCDLCAADLPLGPRPVVHVRANARIMIIGQAPGTRVHETGIPWNDPSGERLREWLQIDRETFYDANTYAIIPMGFCYPGKGKSGDLPPRPECAPMWHEELIKHLPNLKLTLLIGQYAQRHYLAERMKRNLTETVRHAEEYLPDYFPLVHPSPRNHLWLKKNPWFERETLPLLRRSVKNALS